jgi:hypothetical protein
LHKNNIAAVLTALLLSAVLFTTGAGAFQSAKAQLNPGQSLLGTLTNARDQIVKGGNHVVDQISKGGTGFLSALGAAAPGIRVHLDTAYQDMVNTDNAGARTELKQLYANFLNDSGTIYGLGQELNQIAQNNSAQTDSHTKQILAAIGTDLKQIALNTAAKSNSTNNGTGH